MKEVNEMKAAAASARARSCLGDITNKLRRLSQVCLSPITATTRANLRLSHVRPTTVSVADPAQP